MGETDLNESSATNVALCGYKKVDRVADVAFVQVVPTAYRLDPMEESQRKLDAWRLRSPMQN